MQNYFAQIRSMRKFMRSQVRLTIGFPVLILFVTQCCFTRLLSSSSYWWFPSSCIFISNHNNWVKCN